MHKHILVLFLLHISMKDITCIRTSPKLSKGMGYMWFLCYFIFQGEEMIHGVKMFIFLFVRQACSLYFLVSGQYNNDALSFY